MIEKMITKKVMKYINNYLTTDNGNTVYVNIFNSGIIINLSIIKNIIATKGQKYLEQRIEEFIKSNL